MLYVYEESGQVLHLILLTSPLTLGHCHHRDPRFTSRYDKKCSSNEVSYGLKWFHDVKRLTDRIS